MCAGQPGIAGVSGRLIASKLSMLDGPKRLDLVLVIFFLLALFVLLISAVDKKVVKLLLLSGRPICTGERERRDISTRVVELGEGPLSTNLPVGAKDDDMVRIRKTFSYITE